MTKGDWWLVAGGWGADHESPITSHQSPVTPSTLLRTTTDRLAAAGVPDPQVDAEWLLAHCLGGRRVDLALQARQPLTSIQQRQCEQFVTRRLRREPLQYILGTQSFYGRDFRVTPDVLIPRPETETLVERALAVAKQPLQMLDLCTGSGCIAITLALERPAARITATDTSAAALTVARENAARHEIQERIAWFEADLFPPSPATYDVIISNPPYCPEAVWPTLQPEVRDWEPQTAVVSGNDGLALLRRIVQDAWRWLRAGGVLALEVGDDQAAHVVRSMETTGHYTALKIHRDLTGRERVITAEA
ncbi:MAG: peptide chain release factor N(5)-glutamine methyltransferase [Deltaproteobacteria bacterium]|nr:peptide chain release factor N(5)-glutamine methyltransferase [Deltaproteobacteria bacterium]